jgi:hypothetical protein
VPPSLNDLRRIFYGAGPTESVSDAEWEFMRDAAAAGVNALTLIAGSELGYAKRETNYVPGTGALQDIPGLSVTFVAKDTSAWLKAEANLKSTLANDTANLYITDSANNGLAAGTNTNSVASGVSGVHIERKVDGLIIGNSYTYKVRAAAAFGGNIAIDATALAPAWIAAFRP